MDSNTFTLRSMDNSQNIGPLSLMIIIMDLAILFLHLMEEYLLFLIIWITISLYYEPLRRFS